MGATATFEGNFRLSLGIYQNRWPHICGIGRMGIPLISPSEDIFSDSFVMGTGALTVDDQFILSNWPSFAECLGPTPSLVVEN